MPSSINLSTMTFSHSVIIMLASTGPSDPPILTPSNCSYILLLKEKAGFWQVPKISFLSERLGSDIGICFSLQMRLRMILKVFFQKFYTKHFVLFVCLNIRLKIRWTSSDYYLLYISGFSHWSFLSCSKSAKWYYVLFKDSKMTILTLTCSKSTQWLIIMTCSKSAVLNEAIRDASLSLKM